MSEPIFSPEDSDLADMKWCLDRYGYARKSIRRRPLKQTNLFAHHAVCLRVFGRRPDWSKREVCDHINRDKLDNRRENLRIVSVAENNRNMTPSKGHRKNTDPWGEGRGWNHYTRHKGGRYQSQFHLGGRSIYVGLFDTAEEARAATLKAKAEALARAEDPK